MQRGNMALVLLLPAPLAHQRGKIALVLLSAPLAHAASARPAPVMSTAQDSQIDGGFQLVSHKVQYTNPGLACSPD